MAWHVEWVDLYSTQECGAGAIMRAEGKVADAKRLEEVARQEKLEQHSRLDQTQSIGRTATGGQIFRPRRPAKWPSGYYGKRWLPWAAQPRGSSGGSF
jgi:hypothetical protein